MEKISAHTRQNAYWCAFICTLLFALFSISYLMLQGEAIRSVHHTLAEGKTIYSPVYGACIITVILCLLQWGLNKITRFRHSWIAVSYFPAFLLLTVLSCIYPSTTGNGQSFVLCFYNGLGWWCFAGLMLYILLNIVYRKYIFSRITKSGFQQLLIPNLLVMITYTYTTGYIGNNNELLYNELSIAQCIQTNQYDRALSIGKKSLHNSHTLTALRAFALSQTDSLGQSLFRYPQSDGSEGLFFKESKGATSSLTNADIYSHLGGIPRKDNETPVHYLRKVCENGGSHKTLDYYLCTLLLERQLEAFVAALDTYWEEEDSLPCHYQEALLIHEQRMIAPKDKASQVPTGYFAQISPYVRQCYEAFKNLQEDYPQAILQRNYTRRKYGDTYWWYYHYGE